LLQNLLYGYIIEIEIEHFNREPQITGKERAHNMRRNVDRLISKGEETIATRQIMTVSELQHIYEMYKAEPVKGNGLFKALCAAFYFGYAVGAKLK